MSYILSALKKVERDRQTGTTPNLMSVQIEEAAPTAPRNRLSTSAVMIGMVALLAVIVWNLPHWVVGTDWKQILNNVSVAEHITMPRPSPLTTSQAQPRSPAVDSSFNAMDADEQAGEFAALEQDRISDPYLLPASQSGRVLTLEEIDPEVRSRIPTFSVSGYLYSAQRPQASSTIINGVRLRAGQYVSEELMVKEINPDHIVMDFRGMLFQVEQGEFFRN